MLKTLLAGPFGSSNLLHLYVGSTQPRRPVAALFAVVPRGGLEKVSAIGKSGPGPVEWVHWATGKSLYGSPKAHYGVELAEKRLLAPFRRLWREV